MTRTSDELILVVSLWVGAAARLTKYPEFERQAARLMRPHGGSIERVVRIDELDPDAPFEVHVVRFPSREAFAAYRADPATAGLVAIRDEVIQRTEILFGIDIAPYG